MSASDDRDWLADMQRRTKVIQSVLDERVSQDNKWGPLPRNHGDRTWLTVLVEEVGEVARASLEHQDEHLLVELVQVAAVAVAWVEENLMLAEAAAS